VQDRTFKDMCLKVNSTGGISHIVLFQGHVAVALNVLSSSVFIYRVCYKKPDNLLEWKFEFLGIL